MGVGAQAEVGTGRAAGGAGAGVCADTLTSTQPAVTNAAVVRNGVALMAKRLTPGAWSRFAVRISLFATVRWFDYTHHRPEHCRGAKSESPIANGECMPGI